jgi:PAS domain S-box-containing protein
VAQTILLVEDERIVALMEKKTLEGFGYSVLTASSGEEAEEAACGVDLVLMDIDLGSGIDGTEAARRILSRRNLPIVFLTAHSERECVEKVRGITRYGYVIKNSGDFVLQSSIEMAFELFAAHEKMRADEARLETLLKTIPDLVWLKDAEGVYVTCNPAFERLYGASLQEIAGKTDFDFIPAEQAEFFRMKDREAAAYGGPRSNEEWLTFADDGHKAFMETIKTPMLDASGKLIGVLGIGRDITERNRMETALKESEETVKRKLDAITAPDGDLGELGLSDIVDVPMIRSLMEDFSALTGMVVALLDTEGRVLVATGWQDICTKYHRAAEESSLACTESDLYLSANAKPGECIEYRCKNHMWDVVTPLFVEDRHVGNIYSGQYFYDDDLVDEGIFEAQAERFGYDKEAYLSALRRVPRYSRGEIARLMAYLVKFTQFVSRLSYSNLKLAGTIAQKRRAEEELSKSVREKEILLKELQHRVKNSLNIVSSLLRLNMAELEDQRSARVFQEAIDRVKCVSTIYEKLSESASVGSVDLSRYLSDLVALLRSGYATKVESLRIDVDIARLECDLKRAVSLGLILNELLTNAIKYAYSPGEDGEIRVRLKGGTPDWELSVSDDGPGLPSGFDAKDVASLGLRLAGLLAQDVDGSLEFSGGKGLTAVLRFKGEAAR